MSSNTSTALSGSGPNEAGRNKCRPLRGSSPAAGRRAGRFERSGRVRVPGHRSIPPSRNANGPKHRPRSAPAADENEHRSKQDAAHHRKGGEKRKPQRERPGRASIGTMKPWSGKLRSRQPARTARTGEHRDLQATYPGIGVSGPARTARTGEHRDLMARRSAPSPCTQRERPGRASIGTHLPECGLAGQPYQRERPGRASIGTTPGWERRTAVGSSENGPDGRASGPYLRPPAPQPAPPSENGPDGRASGHRRSGLDQGGGYPSENGPDGRASGRLDDAETVVTRRASENGPDGRASGPTATAEEAVDRGVQRERPGRASIGTPATSVSSLPRRPQRERPGRASIGTDSP